MKIIILLLIALLTGCTQITNMESNNTSLPNNTSSTVSVETTVQADTSSLESDTVEVYTYHYIQVEPITQNNDLITGCELVSLAIVYNYYGIPVDKITIAKQYTPYTSNINTGFVGNPWSSHGMGCMPSVLDMITKSVILDYQYDGVFDTIILNNVELQNLYYYIEKDIPIIIWATQSMCIHGARVSYDDGGYFKGEHCLVFTGYNIQSDIAYVSDPQKGNTQYPLSTVINRYNSVGQHAYVIRKVES